MQPAIQHDNASGHSDDALLQSLIRTTRLLISLTQREIQALEARDFPVFVDAQKDKAGMTRDYADACQDFQNNIERFRDTSPAMLSRVEALQTELGKLSERSNTLVKQVFTPAHGIVAQDNTRPIHTQATLLSAQEIGQGQ